ncbi:thiamine pyrophosphate-dependent dehydrogenase E1 component subunit alpha [Variovorax sp. J22R133]|uniref:thiamine pyrophosphate-dependent dehydrogenase E1 component subunit alpha n=1 Tax=Variovorax brevis TaxID=3053503 RepID=UPI0025753E1A|nr:thiamine pyrophosphate-dependent dehydrogenase E1 component subunit alpha [Variovorax sp. J22R133]MDM0115799.1 thiamine pyrophosphate-dependent dehydrogenase E1 component subunit alpha [Variovorax sp. J22R133]
MDSKIPEADRLALYRTMVRIRAFENAAEIASQGGVSAYGQQAGGAAKVRGPLHLSTGQEAVPAGVCAHLRPSDYLTSTHRGHGHTLAKGADLTRMMCELFGKATGFNGGKGGSMHIADFSVGMLGANGVVAAGLPIAVGAAHAQKIRKAAQGRSQAAAAGNSPGASTPGSNMPHDAITVCFFGDGAINRGPFLESLNWARVFDLPVLFVCEDNQWSATTASGPMTAGEGASARAASMDIVSHKVDGNDVFAVHEAAAALVDEVRAGRGPRLLHAITYRVKGHVSVDAAAYRDPAELAAALETDPIANARAQCLAAGIGASALDAIDAQAHAEVDAALAAADAAPWPSPEAAFTDIQDTGAGQWT